MRERKGKESWRRKRKIRKVVQRGERSKGRMKERKEMKCGRRCSKKLT